MGAAIKTDVNEWRQFVSHSLAEIVPLTETISGLAQQLMEQFGLDRRLSASDALVAASALVRREPLATGNLKHFDFIPGLAVKLFCR